ncbi:hypothetical protein IWQ61_005782 [Dispira simplex]|nr:hypothetical protein IWQ61_005782 [Dispira simplex]
MGNTDSKITFRKGIFRLSQERRLAATDDYWASLWNVPDSADDIFSLFTTQDIRRIRDQAPENLVTLVSKLYEHLHQIKSSGVFVAQSPPKPEGSSATDDTKPPTSQMVQAATKQLLNCIRLLTRLLPFVYEVPVLPGTNTTLAEQLLWTRSGDQTKRFGDRLIHTTVDLLFLAGFTVPKIEKAEDASPTLVNYCIWESGIGQTQLISTNKEHVFHRLEVMRLLLCLLSSSMYTKADSILTTRNQAVDTLAYHSDKKVVLTLLCSLINTAMKYKASGWGIPYKMKPAHDPHDLLAVYCLQTLLILLNTRDQPRLGDTAPDKGGLTPTLPDASPVEPMAKNQFRGYLCRLHRNGDFAFLVSNIHRILGVLMRARTSYFQLTTGKVQHTLCQESLMLLWALLQLNPKFTIFLVDSEEFLSIMTAVGFFALDRKIDPLMVGQVRMAVFLLHMFSEEPKFGERLNNLFDQTVLPTDMRLPLSQVIFADYLVYVFYTLIITTKKLHVALYPTILIILRNVAPYIQGLSSFASDKLVRLLVVFANPHFFLANETNYRLLLYTLETINYLVHYQLRENMWLLYALVRANDTLQMLIQFDSDAGLAEYQQAQEQRALGHLSDKARGKLPENSPGMEPTTPTTHVNSSEGGEHEGQRAPQSPHAVFRPTLEWLNDWFKKLPLASISELLNATVPYVQEQLEATPLQSDTQVLVLLRSDGLAKRLPVSLSGGDPPIMVRHLRWSNPLSAWYTGLLWSQVYVAGTAPLGLWNGTHIKLFQVKTQ